MSEKTQWSKYIDATSGNSFNSAIAEEIGVDPATIGRWRAGTVDPKPRQVVAYARAYGQSPIAALIAAGYLTEEEAGLPTSPPRSYTLDDFSPLELAEELAQRLGEADGYRVIRKIGVPVLAAVEDGRIVPLASVGGPDQDLSSDRAAARRRDRDSGEDTDAP